jgi:protein TonB
LLRLQASVVLALLLTVGAFRVQYHPSTQFEIAEATQQDVVMEEIVQTDHIAKPPPPPRPPVPIEVPNDELIEEVALDLDAEIDLTEALEVPPPPPPPPAVEEEPEPDIFVIVEEMPQMVGGLEKLYQDLLYPERALKAGIEGQVVVQIVILEDGTPTSPTVLRSAGEILNKAAIRALMAQRFRPGKQRGRAVRVQMAFPITFRLTEGSPA